MLARIIAGAALCALAGCDDDGSGAARCADGSAPRAVAGELDACPLAGVPATACAPGFVADGAQGCLPLLPDEPCPAGELAFLGESACHPLADCGTDLWNDLPAGRDVVFVHAGYAGGDSDGSRERPWLTIGQAVAAAPNEALIAIADGVYAESVTIAGKTLHLQGRCPALVELSSPTVGSSLIIEASGSSARSLALGGMVGVEVRNAEKVTLERLWIGGMQPAGLSIDLATVTASELLIEGALGTGVFLVGGTLALARSVVRNDAGIGIVASYDNAGGNRPVLELDGVVIERNEGAGILALDAHVRADGLVIRNVDALGRSTTAAGVIHADSEATADQAELELRRSFLTANDAHGLFLYASAAIVEDTVLRETSSAFDGTLGRAVEAQAGVPGRSDLVLRRSLVESGHDTGVYVADSDVRIEATVVRAVAANEAGLFGDGVSALSLSEPASIELVGSVVASAQRVAVASYGASVHLEGSLFDCNPIDLDGEGEYLVEGRMHTRAFEFVDAGGNRCGCGAEAATCQVRTTVLTPPTPGDLPDGVEP